MEAAARARGRASTGCARQHSQRQAVARRECMCLRRSFMLLSLLLLRPWARLPQITTSTSTPSNNSSRGRSRS